MTDILTSVTAVWFVSGSNSAHRFAASTAVGTFNQIGTVEVPAFAAEWKVR
jgi:hypothetical protein